MCEFFSILKMEKILLIGCGDEYGTPRPSCIFNKCCSVCNDAMTKENRNKRYNSNFVISVQDGSVVKNIAVNISF